jgi:hypothetical protein
VAVHPRRVQREPETLQNQFNPDPKMTRVARLAERVFSFCGRNRMTQLKLDRRPLVTEHLEPP